MTTNRVPKGVLDSNYARNRSTKKELYFRYRVRGAAVVEAWKNHSHHNRPISMLDMGAADGKTLCHIAKFLSVTEAVGVEYNQELINRANQATDSSNASVRIVRGDITNLPEFDDGSFDLVTALAVLEHIPDPSRAISEAARILKLGGILVATSPVPFWDHLAVKTGMLKEDHHECDMHPRKFKNFICEEKSLELIDYRRFMFAPIGVLPYFGIQPSPAASLKIDRIFHFLPFSKWLFVNQIVIARRI